MTDLAALGLSVRSDGVVVATDALDKFKRSSDRAADGAGKVEKRSAGMGAALAKLGRIAAPVALAVGSLFSIGALTRGIAEFDSSMSRAAAVTRATQGDLQRLRETAQELGATTEFSAAQAADALTFLGMAGFSAAESVAALPPVLDLATASGMGLAGAADTASNIMSAFGIAAQDAANVTDVLAAASTRANTNVAQLGQAISTAGPIAATLGIALEDTAAAIGVMSDAGIQGERAGTALRGVMAALAGPTTQAQEALAKYGLTAADVDPATRSLADIMDTLASSGLSTADAMTIFGREAASGALVMVQASDRLRTFGDELRNVDGAASDMAATMRDNLQGDLQGLSSAVSALIITIGDAGLTAALRGTVQAMTNLVRLIADNFVPIMEAASGAVIALASTQIPALVVGLSTMASGMSAAAIVTGVLTSALGALRVAVALAGGPWGILAGLIAGAASYFLLFRDNATEAERAIDDTKAAQDALNAAMGVFWQTAGPESAAKAIDAANAYREQAAAARDAAAAELARREAMLDTQSGRMKRGGMLNVDAAESDLAAAQRLLDEARLEADRAVREVTGSMTLGGTSLSNANGELKNTIELTGDLANALGKSGAAGNAGELTDEMKRLQAEMDSANMASERWANNMAGHFDGLITGGKDFSDVLMSIARQLESSAWQSLFSGNLFGGGGGGLFSGIGSFFSGFFDQGGMIPAGGVGIVGERGPEFVRGPAQVTSRADTARMMQSSNGGGQVVIKLDLSRDVEARIIRNTTGQTVQIVSSALGANRQALPGQIDTISNRGE